MHTYKITLAETERPNLLNKLNREQTVVLSEMNSDNYYLIMPADSAQTLFDLALEFQKPVERITITALKEKYSSKHYQTLLGDAKLVDVLFQ